jgi:signal transduction histidine kinase
LEPAPTILIIDDSSHDQARYARLLRGDPEIGPMRTARSGAEGIDVYRQAPADCVLLDYRLPGGDGVNVLKALKALDPHLAVVMLTGQGNEAVAVEALRAGAQDYVLKDQVSGIGLKRTIRHAIDRARMQRAIERRHDEQKQFLQSLTHDIRAPLRNLATFADMIDEDLRAGVHDSLEEHVEGINRSVTRIDDLVDTLGAYALLEGEMTLAETAVDAVVDAAIDHLRLVILKRRATVEHAGLPTLVAHGPQLVQLFQNLIGNALKFNRSRSPLVRIEAAPAAAGAWRFEVSDNGIGVPADRRASIFEPFNRVWSQDRYPGTGFGLTICKRIVERHGGRIWCESEGGDGSRFCFTIPALDQAVDGCCPAEASGSPALAHKLG